MKTLLLSILLGIAAYFLPINAIEPAARVLVPAVALMATGIFPCMSLAVGAMKGEHRTPSLVNDLYAQLERLLKLLIMIFGIAVVAVLAMAAAAAAAGLWTTTQARLADLPKGTAVQVPLPALVHVACATSGFVLGILAGRVVDLGRAFFAVLEINRTHALLIARAKLRGEHQTAIEVAKRDQFATDDMKPRPMERIPS